MSLLDSDDLIEQQKINELEQKIRREKVKLDKKLTRQKIVLGAFLLRMLENDEVAGLREYTAQNLGDFLTRKNDIDNFKPLIDNLSAAAASNDETKPPVYTASELEFDEVPTHFND